MPYCVNCGVELDASAKECPLCSTPVLNPADVLRAKGAYGERGEKAEVCPPFPKEKGQVESVSRKDLGVLLSMVVLATAVTCGLLNAFVFRGALWSLAVIGACGILWVMMVPAVIYREMPIYFSLLLDGAAVALYLYMLTFQIGSSGWFWGLGLPVTAAVTGIGEILTACIRKLPRSFLTVLLYLLTAIGLLCAGLELLIRRYLMQEMRLSWSAVVMMVCFVLDIALITMLSRRRLRDEVRRRLHF